MKLRTRLLITSLTIIILPLALTFIAFFCIGTVILRSNQNDFHIQTIDYSLMSDTVQSLCDITEEVFHKDGRIKLWRAASQTTRIYISSLSRGKHASLMY